MLSVTFAIRDNCYRDICYLRQKLSETEAILLVESIVTYISQRGPVAALFPVNEFRYPPLRYALSWSWTVPGQAFSGQPIPGRGQFPVG